MKYKKLENIIFVVKINLRKQNKEKMCFFYKKPSTRMGFEPTRAEHIGLAVQRLNHSATSSGTIKN